MCGWRSNGFTAFTQGTSHSSSPMSPELPKNPSEESPPCLAACVWHSPRLAPSWQRFHNSVTCSPGDKTRKAVTLGGQQDPVVWSMSLEWTCH